MWAPDAAIPPALSHQLAASGIDLSVGVKRQGANRLDRAVVGGLTFSGRRPELSRPAQRAAERACSGSRGQGSRRADASGGSRTLFFQRRPRPRRPPVGARLLRRGADDGAGFSCQSFVVGGAGPLDGPDSAPNVAVVTALASERFAIAASSEHSRWIA